VIEILVEDQVLRAVNENPPGFGSRSHQGEVVRFKPVLETEFPGIGRGNPDDVGLNTEIRHDRTPETAHLDGVRIISVRKPEPLVFGQHAEEKDFDILAKKSIFD
jgi:hypothetical protein